jgi:hypothetical protein
MERRQLLNLKGLAEHTLLTTPRPLECDGIHGDEHR